MVYEGVRPLTYAEGYEYGVQKNPGHFVVDGGNEVCSDYASIDRYDHSTPDRDWMQGCTDELDGKPPAPGRGVPPQHDQLYQQGDSTVFRP